MRPVPLASWIQCLVLAGGVHVLAAAIAFACLAPHAPAVRPEEPLFHLTLSHSALVPDYVCLPPILPHCGSEPRPSPTVLPPELERELKALGRDHAWAGEYLARGRNLFIAPRCGSWLDEGGRTLAHPVECSDYEGITSITAWERQYLSVHWGQRHYLIEVNEWSRFVKALRSGAEPRHERDGPFLLRAGDELLPVEDLPVIMGTP
jgi:hypothetical protein